MQGELKNISGFKVFESKHKPDCRKSKYRIEVKIQTVSRPHEVLAKKKIIVPSMDDAQIACDALLVAYKKQYPKGVPLEISYKFISFQ